MKIRVPLLFLFLAIALPLALLAAGDKPPITPAPAATPDPSAPSSALVTPRPKVTPATTPKMYPLRRLLESVGLRKRSAGGTQTGFKGLEFGLVVDPPQVRIGDTKALKVTITLINRGRKMAQLDFPSSQRFEVLVKTKEGKTIEQWSEDQAFNAEPAMVTINPEERLEYTVSVATRDMVVGQTYTIEAFFPNFEQLRKSVTVAAVVPPPKATPAGGKAPDATSVSSSTPKAGGKGKK
jgi:hypothetical protein